MESNENTAVILTIDDDADVRDALRIVLESEGFTVHDAASGETGLQKAKEVKPDMIIVDLMMETIDAGTIVTQKLNESGYTGPVYLLSSAGDTVRYNIDAAELGLAGVFQKPIQPKALLATVKAKLASV